MGQGLARRFQAEEVYVLAPAGRQPDYDGFHKVITDLWREKIVFGVWQEALLEALPETSRVLICPAGVAPDKAATLERFHKLGVEVYEGYGEEWRSSERLPRVTVESGEDVDALVRRTVGGTLYGLFAVGPARRVKLAHEGHTVELGLADYAMAEEIAGGFRLVEGSGELRVDGELLCEVERGRLIVVSDEGKPLGQAARLQLLASEPTKVRFTRPVALVEALQEGSTGPVGHFRLEGEAYEEIGRAHV